MLLFFVLENNIWVANFLLFVGIFGLQSSSFGFVFERSSSILPMRGFCWWICHLLFNVASNYQSCMQASLRRFWKFDFHLCNMIYSTHNNLCNILKTVYFFCFCAFLWPLTFVEWRNKKNGKKGLHLSNKGLHQTRHWCTLCILSWIRLPNHLLWNYMS